MDYYDVASTYVLFKLALPRDTNGAAQVLTKVQVVFVYFILLTFVVAALPGEVTHRCFHSLGNIRSGEWGIIKYFAVTISGGDLICLLLMYALTLRIAGCVAPSTSLRAA